MPLHIVRFADIAEFVDDSNACVRVDREFKCSKRVKAEEPMSGLRGVKRPGGSIGVQRSAEMGRDTSLSLRHRRPLPPGWPGGNTFYAFQLAAIEPGLSLDHLGELRIGAPS